jgi:NADH:ubiquinone oxidoreductase subunit E
MSVAHEIRKLRKRYPDPASAVLPALRLAQEEYGGWLPPEALREVAEALEVTPAYCVSIASFYDQFYLEPIGRRHVEVCTNGAYTLGTIECLGGCGWATVVAIDNRHRLRVTANDVPGIVEELRG